MIGAEWYSQVGGRRDHRNGSYVRHLLTSLGGIEVTVPQAREGGSVGETLGRYRRRTEAIDRMITNGYVNGVSTRKTGELTEG